MGGGAVLFPPPMLHKENTNLYKFSPPPFESHPLPWQIYLYAPAGKPEYFDLFSH